MWELQRIWQSFFLWGKWWTYWLKIFLFYLFLYFSITNSYNLTLTSALVTTEWLDLTKKCIQVISSIFYTFHSRDLLGLLVCYRAHLLVLERVKNVYVAICLVKPYFHNDWTTSTINSNIIKTGDSSYKDSSTTDGKWESESLRWEWMIILQAVNSLLRDKLLLCKQYILFAWF